MSISAHTVGCVNAAVKSDVASLASGARVCAGAVRQQPAGFMAAAQSFWIQMRGDVPRQLFYLRRCGVLCWRGRPAGGAGLSHVMQKP